MLIRRLSLLILLALTQYECNASLTFLTNNISHPHQGITFDHHTFKDPRLLYAICDHSPNAKRCQVIREKSPFQNDTDTCEIILKVKRYNGYLEDHTRVVPFGSDKAILAWVEKSESEWFLGLTTVRFSDCSVHELSYPFDGNTKNGFALQSLVSLVTHGNSYDVVFVSPKVCDNHYCRMTVDVETNRIEGPTAWFTINRRDEYVDLASLQSIDNKYLVFQYGFGRANFKTLGEHEYDQETLKHYECRHPTSPCTYAHTTTNNLIGICNVIHERLGCAQFNQSGIEIFDSDKLVGDQIVTAVHNLADDGMLVFLDHYRTGNYEVLHLDNQGQYNGSLYFEYESKAQKSETLDGQSHRRIISMDFRYKCDRSKYITSAQFYEDKGHYCASVACYENTHLSKKDYKGLLAVNTHCFDIDDFVVQSKVKEITVVFDNGKTNKTKTLVN